MCSKSVSQAVQSVSKTLGLSPEGPKLPKPEKQVQARTTTAETAGEKQAEGVRVGRPDTKKKRGAAALVIPLQTSNRSTGGVNLPR